MSHKERSTSNLLRSTQRTLRQIFIRYSFFSDIRISDDEEFIALALQFWGTKIFLLRENKFMEQDQYLNRPAPR